MPTQTAATAPTARTANSARAARTARSGLTRVLIVDDSAVVRERLASLLSSASGIDVVAEAGNVATAREAIAQATPDAIILDLGLPDGSGLQVLEELQRGELHPEVI